ncbi:MAG: hypothetical protein FJ144_23890 [Deltaproteobacteria bacterium]|nr:hypothetical protein [Deltaproteobacteria bacterium]
MRSTESALDWRRAALLAAVALVVYNANFRAISAGDCFPARFLPFAIWGSGTLSIEPIADVVRVDRENPFWIVGSDLGGRVSMYPIVTPVLVTPLYAPAAAYLRWTGWRTSDLIVVGEVMEKLAASFVAALVVGLAYLLFRRGAPRREATWLAVALAFGTGTWVTSSQALWQHGIAELLVVLALLLVTGTSRDGKRLFALGVICGLLAANRPPDAALAAGFGAAVLILEPRRAWIALVGALAAYAPFAAYNWVHFHDLGGGYAAAFKAKFGSVSGFFPNSVWEGLFGIFFSPGKGLFVFCPFLLFLVLAARRSVRERFDPRVAVPLLGGVVLQLFL